MSAHPAPPALDTADHPGTDRDRPADLRLPGVVLGVGLGGFIDGIVLHQLLQWHHMLTGTDTDRLGLDYYDPATVPGLQMNTVWDGIVHVTTWLCVLLGLGLLHSRLSRRRDRVVGARGLWGWVLVGWGLFNLVEGVLNHHVMGIHHVRSGPHELAYDLAFLALGAVLIGVGRLLARGADREAGA